MAATNRPAPQINCLLLVCAFLFACAMALLALWFLQAPPPDEPIPMAPAPAPMAPVEAPPQAEPVAELPTTPPPADMATAVVAAPPPQAEPAPVTFKVPPDTYGFDPTVFPDGDWHWIGFQGGFNWPWSSTNPRQVADLGIAAGLAGGRIPLVYLSGVDESGENKPLVSFGRNGAGNHYLYFHGQNGVLEVEGPLPGDDGNTWYRIATGLDGSKPRGFVPGTYGLNGPIDQVVWDPQAAYIAVAASRPVAFRVEPVRGGQATKVWFLNQEAAALVVTTTPPEATQNGDGVDHSMEVVQVSEVMHHEAVVYTRWKEEELKGEELLRRVRLFLALVGAVSGGRETWPYNADDSATETRSCGLLGMPLQGLIDAKASGELKVDEDPAGICDALYSNPAQSVNLGVLYWKYLEGIGRKQIKDLPGGEPKRRFLDNEEAYCLYGMVHGHQAMLQLIESFEPGIRAPQGTPAMASNPELRKLDTYPVWVVYNYWFRAVTPEILTQDYETPAATAVPMAAPAPTPE